jgi:chaperonin GroES
MKKREQNVAKGKKTTGKKAATKAAPAKKAVQKNVKKTSMKTAAKTLSSTKATGKKAASMKTSSKGAANSAKTSAKKTSPPKSLSAKATSTKKSATAKGAASTKASLKKSASAKTPSSKATIVKAAPKAGTAGPASGKSTNQGKLDLSDFVTPLDDRVLVQPKEAETRTAGGLYIPDTASDRSSNVEGLVVSVGRGHRNKKGHIRPMDVKVGDKVLFAKHSGSEIKVQNHSLLILREGDVLGIIES